MGFEKNVPHFVHDMLKYIFEYLREHVAWLGDHQAFLSAKPAAKVYSISRQPNIWTDDGQIYWW